MKLEIENESHKHSKGWEDSHFKIRVVSDLFTGLSWVQWHWLVNETLKEELKKVHSIALNTLDNNEFASASKFVIPGCTK